MSASLHDRTLSLPFNALQPSLDFLKPLLPGVPCHHLPVIPLYQWNVEMKCSEDIFNLVFRLFQIDLDHRIVNEQIDHLRRGMTE